jgi:hypothetical protein
LRGQLKLWLHLLRAAGLVLLAAVALAGVVLAYFALQPDSRRALRAATATPVPLWILGVSVLIVLVLVVAYVTSRLDTARSAESNDESRAAGLARELESGLSDRGNDVIWDDRSSSDGDRVQYVVEMLEQLMASPRTEAVEYWEHQLRQLPGEAFALLSLISRGRHLEGDEIARLRNTELWPSLQALRRAGCIEPMLSAIEENPVYWLPNGRFQAIKEALQHLPGLATREDLTIAARTLRSVDYDLPPDVVQPVVSE